MVCNPDASVPDTFSVYYPLQVQYECMHQNIKPRPYTLTVLCELCSMLISILTSPDFPNMINLYLGRNERHHKGWAVDWIYT